VSDVAETYLTTDPAKPCAQTPVAPGIDGRSNDETPLDNWPMDFTDDRQAAGADLLKFNSVFGKAVNAGPFAIPGYSYLVPGERFDLSLDGIISGPDILKFPSVFGGRCGTAVSGTTFGIPDWAQQ
jgi:hypothetical protein